MAVTIQDGIVNAPNGKGVRSIAATADGTLWACVYSDLATDRFEFWYSTNEGVSWTENTSLRVNASSSSVQFAFAINTVNDIAVFRENQVPIKSIRGLTTSSTTWTAAAAGGIIATAAGFPDMVVFDKPGSTNFFVATLWDQGTVDRLDVTEFTSAGARVAQIVDVSTGSANGTASLDFNHTGDGNTVASSTPHLYVSYLAFSTLYPTFRKYSYASGSWSAGTIRTLLSNAADDVTTSLVFDGARAIIVAVDSNACDVFERDAADTTTIDRSGTIPASPGGVTAVRVSANGTNGFDVYELDEATDDIDYVTFSRGTASWGSFTEFANYANGLTAAGWSMSKHRVGSLTPSVWLVDDGTNYDLDTDNRTFNQAPLAPTWSSPADNAVRDETATLPVTWTFNDPDAGDTQSAYSLRRTISAVVTYYNAGAGTWSGTEVKNTSTTEGVTLPATWGADGDVVGFAVKTWDAADVEGVYGSTLTVTGSTKVNPTLTAPTDASTITTSRVTATWTVAEQTAYRLRVLTSADVVLYDSGKVTSTATTLEAPVDLADGLTGAKVEVRTWNDVGLESSTDTHTFDVDYVEPASPTYTVEADDTAARIEVSIFDPVPTGSQPTVTAHDVHVRVAAGGRADRERPVGGDGIRIATDVTARFSGEWNLTVDFGNANTAGAAVYLSGDLFINDTDADANDQESRVASVVAGDVIYLDGWSFVVATTTDNGTHYQFTGTVEGTLPDTGTYNATPITTARFLDYAAASGVDYEYRTLAKAGNGTSVLGGWT